MILATHTEAAVLYRTNEPLRIVPLELPPLKPGQVKVDVAYSGVCKSQVLEVRGLRGPDRFLPHTLGHEGAGIVIDVGPGVQKVKPGDRVVLSWIKGAGADVPSTVYRSADGPVNSGAISTFMRQTVTCENRVTPVPATMPLREGALLGCAVPTGAGIIMNRMNVTAGSSVAVFGVGGIGLGAVAGAKMQNAAIIIAVDVLDHKLEQARAVGATHVVNGAREDAVAAIRAIVGRGVDYAIESAGQRETMEGAFQSIRDAGGLCVLAGNLPHGQRIAIDPFDLIRGKQLAGTWGGETVLDRDVPLYVNLHLAGKLALGAFITHEYPLEDINAALDDLESGRVGRALIKMNTVSGCLHQEPQV